MLTFQDEGKQMEGTKSKTLLKPQNTADWKFSG